MTTYIVDRDTWYRGKGRNSSFLLTREGQRCCIGFVGKQCGVPDKDMVGVGGVRGVPGRHSWPTWFDAGVRLSTMSDLYRAYEINDDMDITDEIREARLQELFQKHGDTIIFYNSKPNGGNNMSTATLAAMVLRHATGAKNYLKTFYVGSQTDPNIEYIVHNRRNVVTHRKQWTCNCPDFTERQVVKNGTCKHIAFVQSQLIASSAISTTGTPPIGRVVGLRCTQCGINWPEYPGQTMEKFRWAHDIPGTVIETYDAVSDVVKTVTAPTPAVETRRFRCTLCAPPGSPKTPETSPASFWPNAKMPQQTLADFKNYHKDSVGSTNPERYVIEEAPANLVQASPETIPEPTPEPVRQLSSSEQQAKSLIDQIVVLLNSGEGRTFWNVISALRGPDSGDESLKYDTTATLRAAIGIEPGACGLTVADKRTEPLGLDAADPERQYGYIKVSDEVRNRFEKAQTHFVNHYGNALIALKKLGYIK